MAFSEHAESMTIRINSPESAVAATPYLFGFVPTDSLVLLFSDPGTMRRSMRVDLPEDIDLRWLQSVLAAVPEQTPSSVILIAYADTVSRAFANDVVDWVMQVLTPLTDVLDLVVVHDGLVHSLLAAVRDGDVPVPVATLEDHPIVAELVAEGMAKVPTRQVLEDRLRAVDDDIAHDVLRLLGQDEPTIGSYEQWRDQLEQRGLEALLSEEDLRATDVMSIGLACADVFARDPLITLLLEQHEANPDSLVAVRDRLTFALCRLPLELAGPTSATLALLTWAAGDGAGALIAARYAMDCDPANTLGPLVLEALAHGLPPHTWSMLTKDIPLDVLRGQYRRSA